MNENSKALAIVSYTDERGNPLTITAIDVRRLLVHTNERSEPVTDREIAEFLWLCQYQQLNPFLGDVYLIKYGKKAQRVVSKDVHLRRAVKDPAYDGTESGLILINTEGKVEHRQGAFYLRDKETIVGGWARCFRKERSHSEYVAVSFEEYAGRTIEGKLNQQWATKSATMIVKVAESQVWRKTFPQLEKLYAAEETVQPGEIIDITAEKEAPAVPQAAKQEAQAETLKATTSPRAKELYRQYIKKLEITKALTNIERGKAIVALAKHEDNVEYLEKALARLQEKEQEAEIPFDNKSIFGSAEPDAVPATAEEA